ncbi:MAG: bacillithiol biosynthesis deacetylase BshB1 [Bacteroidia bacterium]
MKTDILALGAHPDDIELGAGGTILAEVAAGRKIGIIDLTRGELGTRGTPDDRDREAAQAAAILGVEFRLNMGFRDGFFRNDEEHQLALIPYIRRFKPEIVLCNAVNDRHTDHGKAGDLVSVACFLSGLARVNTYWENEPQQAWRPKAVYRYIQDRFQKPDFVYDVSKYFNRKMDAVLAFKTQFYNPDSSEPNTPISSLEFLEFLKARAISLGRPSGFNFAEGFNVEREIGVESLFNLR